MSAAAGAAPVVAGAGTGPVRPNLTASPKAIVHRGPVATPPITTQAADALRMVSQGSLQAPHPPLGSGSVPSAGGGGGGGGLLFASTPLGGRPSPLRRRAPSPRASGIAGLVSGAGGSLSLAPAVSTAPLAGGSMSLVPGIKTTPPLVTAGAGGLGGSMTLSPPGGAARIMGNMGISPVRLRTRATGPAAPDRAAGASWRMTQSVPTLCPPVAPPPPPGQSLVMRPAAR